jgi:hypothetical protein
MNRTKTVARGLSCQAGTAGRTGRVSRDFPREDYHAGGRGARGELVFPQTARGLPHDGGPTHVR